MFSHFGYEQVTSTNDQISHLPLSSLFSKQLPPQINLVLRLNDTGIPRQRQLRLVVLVKRIYELALRSRQHRLRLDHRQIVIHPCLESVTRVLNFFGRQLF